MVEQTLSPCLLSLVIATYQDEGDLVNCLQSLQRINTELLFEVIIVDQNADDTVQQHLVKFVDLAIRHVKVDFIGANRARNFGATLAKGAWLSFPDDDIVFTKTSLCSFLGFTNLPDVSLISGMTVNALGEPNVLRWHNKSRLFNRWNMFSCVTEATIFIKKAVFTAVGGFDERFGPGARYPAAEGIDLINRMFAMNPELVAWYSPTIRLEHPSKVPPWNDWAVSRMGSYGFGDGAMIAKNLNPNILWWGAVTFAAVCLSLFSKNGYKRRAFAARINGMVRGFLDYMRYGKR